MPSPASGGRQTGPGWPRVRRGARAAGARPRRTGRGSATGRGSRRAGALRVRAVPRRGLGASASASVISCSSLAGQPERGRADADDVALGQRRVRDALPIDERAVALPRSTMRQPPAVVAQFRVVAGGAGIGDHDVVLRRPADAQRRGGLRRCRVRLAGGVTGSGGGTACPGQAAAVPSPAHALTPVRGGLRADRAAQHRPVRGLPSRTWHSASISIRSTALAPGIGAIGAAVVRQHPAAVLQLEHGVVPGDADIGDHDVALWIAADHVRKAGRQAPVISLDPHQKRWRGSPRKGLLSVHSPTLERFNTQENAGPAASSARPAASPGCRVSWPGAGYGRRRCL